MKITTTALVYIWLCFLVTAQAQSDGVQPTQTIRGTVIDKDSKTPLIGVNVVIKGSDPLIGSVTDLDGNFRMERVPVGRHDLMVTSVGYEPKLIPNVEVTSGKEVVLPIGLTESITMLEGVVVKGSDQQKEAQNEFSTVSGLSFSMEESSKYAGTFNDPSRMVTAFAGVVGGGGSDDVENEIIIRGNSPKGLLWRVEGVEVPSPNHFTDQGASSGSVSILSSNMLATSDFFTGAFPAEYGNALSGVFDIKLRKGNTEKREYALRAGVIGLDASMEGPFKEGKGSSYLMNYRYSTLALLNDIGIELVDDALPIFQDLAFKVYIPSEKLGYFSIFGIGGLSHETEFTEGRRTDGTYGRVEEEDFTSDLGIFGINHNYIINKKLFVESILSFSANHITFDRDYILNAQGQTIRLTHEDFTDYSGRASVMLNYKANARHLIRTGFIYSHLRYDLLSESYNPEIQGLSSEVDDEGQTNVFQGYVSWKYRLNESLVLNSGLHFMHFLLNDRNSLEPRFGAKWNMTPTQSLSAGIGLHSRRESLATYLYEPPQTSDEYPAGNKNLGFSKAMHYVLGYDNFLTDNLHFRAEVYYQDLFNIPVIDDTFFSVINTRKGFSSFDLANLGTGENYGVELTFERSLSNNYYFNTNVSLFESKYVGGDDIERNSMYSSNFVVNALAGKDFIVSPDKRLNLNVRTVYAGGQRYIPIDLERSRQVGQTVYIIEDSFEDRLEDYFRADFQASYVINYLKSTLEFRLEIQNITDRANVREIFYSPVTGTIEERRRGQLLPILSVQLKF